jgi:tol-pal system protein YbgF
MRDLLMAISVALLGFVDYALADSSITITALPAIASQADAAQPIVAGASLPDGPAQELYDRAFGLLRQADYPAAKRGFEDLLKRYPHDPLAANAQYWLAEIYSVQGDLNAAAAAFAAAYENYPGSIKAGESLIKLGRTYAALGRKSDACGAFARLVHDETAAPVLRNLAQTDARNAKCGGDAGRRKAGVADR